MSKEDSNIKGEIKMEKQRALEKEDFKGIYSEILFFRNRKNSFIEIVYVEYKAIKIIKFYLYNGEIICVDGNIFINTLISIQRRLTDLHIKDID